VTREPVPPTPRKAMTPARRFAVWDRYQGRCAEPTCAVAVPLKGTTIDHIIALELGGADDFDNLQPLCPACDRIKTAQDAGLIAKLRRLLRRQDGTRRERREINSAPFPTHITRGVDGRVRPRIAKESAR